MNSIYEIVEFPDKIPVRSFLYSVETFRLHWHKEIEFLVVLKGSISLIVQHATRVLGEGELAVISSGLIHATQATMEPNILLVVQVNCEGMGVMDEAIESLVFDIGGGTRLQREALRQSLCTIMLEMAYRQTGYRYKTMSLVADALSRLLRDFPHSASQTLEGGRPRERERIDRIVSYINENYTTRLSLGDIARREHLSVNHLSTFIHKTLGMSFGDYVKYIRLKAYMEALQDDDASALDDIAMRCGFSSPQYATALFRDTYNVTPGKYRKRLNQISLVRRRALDADTTMGYVPQYQPDDLSLVFAYARRDQSQEDAARGAPPAQPLAVSCLADGGAYYASAVRVAAIGRAHEGLLADVRRQIQFAKRALGFTHLRFHGILSDDMMILKPAPSGSVDYSWRSVDALLDFLLGIGVRPFIELTFMPSLLASGDKVVFQWRGNITPPGDILAWQRLVERLVAHCVARYGADEVLKWYFEVWNEPDYKDVSWAGGMQEFFDFYADTAQAIVRALPGARVCGPSVSMASDTSRKWIGAFLDYCQQKGAPVDALTFHAYPEIIRLETLQSDLITPAHSRMTAQEVLPPDYVARLTGQAARQLSARNRDIPLIVTEWNITLKAFNPINDAAFAGTALIKSALEADGARVLLAHWTLTDYIEENPLPAAELCGGFGLMTCRDVLKPTFFAMLFLSRLFEQVVYKGEGLIITRKNSRYRVLAYLHPETPLAFDIAYTRYTVPPAAQNLRVSSLLTLTDLPPGDYAVVRQLYDARRCAPRALADEATLVEPLSDEAVAWLAAAARPLYRQETARVAADGALTLPIDLGACSFLYMEITPD